MSNYSFYAANERGKVDIGWLKANHSFSFSNYYNPERMHFGVLRVLNDDQIAPSMGFGMHPHDNMEIITIPLEGQLKHKDDMGNSEVISTGDVQVMSAGTGVRHSEINPNHDQHTKLLQIWLFPNKRNVEPRYQQISFSESERNNKWQQLLSPNANDAGVWIHQDAWFSRSSLQAGNSLTYTKHNANNGIYVFLIAGNITINDQTLQTRDALGIVNEDNVQFTANNSTADILVMELPMA
jgi:quercetin 2,3-dioxygenase